MYNACGGERDSGVVARPVSDKHRRSHGYSDVGDKYCQALSSSTSATSLAETGAILRHTSNLREKKTRLANAWRP